MIEPFKKRKAPPMCRRQLKAPETEARKIQLSGNMEANTKEIVKLSVVFHSKIKVEQVCRFLHTWYIHLVLSN